MCNILKTQDKYANYFVLKHCFKVLKYRNYIQFIEALFYFKDDFNDENI